MVSASFQRKEELTHDEGARAVPHGPKISRVTVPLKVCIMPGVSFPLFFFLHRLNSHRESRRQSVKAAQGQNDRAVVSSFVFSACFFVAVPISQGAAVYKWRRGLRRALITVVQQQQQKVGTHTEFQHDRHVCEGSVVGPLLR